MAIIIGEDSPIIEATPAAPVKPSWPFSTPSVTRGNGTATVTLSGLAPNLLPTGFNKIQVQCLTKSTGEQFAFRALDFETDINHDTESAVVVFAGLTNGTDYQFKAQIFGDV